MVGAVVEEELLIEIPGAEVAPENGEHPVLRLNLAAQRAPQVGEADESLEKVGLALQMPDGLGHGVEDRIGEVSQETGALPQQLLHQVV